MKLTDTPLDPTLSRMDYGRALKGALLVSQRPESWVPYAQPLLDAVLLFEDLHVGYALIGGVAAMYYGRTRFTEDVDFVAATGDMEVLKAHPDEMEKNHFDPTCAEKLCHASGVQVDVWKDEHSDGIIERALEVELAGRTVRMIDPHDLIGMKLRAGRLKDDYDISEIAARTPLDQARLQAMLTPEQLNRLTQIRMRSGAASDRE